jgi:hypothetical protein
MMDISAMAGGNLNVTCHTDLPVKICYESYSLSAVLMVMSIICAPFLKLEIENPHFDFETMHSKKYRTLFDITSINANYSD